MTRAAIVSLLVLALPSAHGADPPPSPREFRAVWVATVGNIDWPSRPGLSVEEQQREATGILDKAARLQLNAVIFQVRPAADALYRSELEPWSYYLTGRQGMPPEPVYDPLEYWIEQNAQKRHIWPGLSVSRVGDGKTSYAPEEILSQIDITRQTSGASGNVLFSMRALQANRRGLCDRLLEGPYRQPALVPPTPWMKTAAPGRPEVTVGDGVIEIRRGRGSEPFVWAIWALEGEEWMFGVEAAQTRRLSVPSGTVEVVVTAVSRLGAESPSVRRELR